MNARQKAKSDMCRIVELVCNENSTILDEVLAFQNAVNKFKTLLAQLHETEQIRSIPLNGITAEKVADRANLCKLAANIAGYIYAYASVTKNETLRGEVDYTHTKFLQMREDQLVTATQNIHSIGSENKPGLKDYGVTDAKLDGLQTAIDAFKSAMTKPGVAKGQKITLTANRDEILAQLNDLLVNQMDLLIQNYEDAHPNFVRRYREARKIKDPATTKTQLKGTVTNAADHSPIKGATVTVVELGISTQTNAAGEYQFKPIEYGEFTVKVTANGFLDFNLDEVRVLLGVVNKLNLELSNVS